MGTTGHICILLYRGASVVDPAVEIGIFGHVACCQFPLAFAGQTVGVYAIFCGQPCTIGRSIRIRNIIYRVVSLPGRIGSVLPVCRSLCASGIQIGGILGIGYWRAADIDAVARTHDGDIIILGRICDAPFQQPGVRKAQHTAIDAVPVGNIHFLHDFLHLGHFFIAAGFACRFHFQLGKFSFLFIQHRIVIFDDHITQGKVVFLRVRFLISGNQLLGFFCQFWLFFFDKIAVFVHCHFICGRSGSQSHRWQNR